MDQEPEQQSKRRLPLVLILIIIIVLLAAAAVVLAVGKFGGGGQPDEEPLSDANAPQIGYEDGLTALDGDTLQEAVDRMNELAAEGGIPLEFQNDAVSPDGEKVECYIANPTKSRYDMYIQIFSDAELTDQLYLSKLIPPGKALRTLYLEKRLEAGTHRVFVVLCQVEDDHATIHQQAVITMDFAVEE